MYNTFLYKLLVKQLHDLTKFICKKYLKLWEFITSLKFLIDFRHYTLDSSGSEIEMYKLFFSNHNIAYYDRLRLCYGAVGICLLIKFIVCIYQKVYPCFYEYITETYYICFSCGLVFRKFIDARFQEVPSYID